MQSFSKMKQYLKLKLSQKLSPQQIQLMKLIQLPTLDFEQKIQREIEENPALEQSQKSNDEKQEDNDDYSDADELNIDDYINYDDTPSYKLNSNNSGRAEEKNIPFSSGISLAETAIELGFYLSMSGIITFPKSNSLCEIFSKVPLDKILVETDSPYLSPAPFRGKRNEPSYIKNIVNKGSEIFSMCPNKFSEITSNNFNNLFKKAIN